MQKETHKLLFLESNRDTFDFIKSGVKTVETRAGSPDYIKIKMGDTVELSCGSDKFTKTVKKVSVFKTLDDLLEVYSPEEINPETLSSEEVIKLYYSFPNYRDRIEKYGMLAFELE